MILLLKIVNNKRIKKNLQYVKKIAQIRLI